MNSFRRQHSRRRANDLSAENPLTLELLEPRMMLSTVQVIAAGELGVEQIQLQIDDAVVATWSDLGTGADSGQFVTRSFTTAGTIAADQVRINFTNDLWDPANNIDRNVRIDAIVIDDVRFETERPTVFSTGTWLPADGIVPGFRQSEFLHANGYFQYAGEPTGGNGSTIEVRASGDEGGEQFNLQIDGLSVANWTATTSFQTFVFDSSFSVTADRIRVEFTNDLWDPGVTDRNLNVDLISVDGQVFQTESPDVFSTGTWLPADGIVPGFRLSETLHANGYFQYANQTTETSNVWILENSEFSGRYLRQDVNGNVNLSTIINARSQWQAITTVNGTILKNVATGQFLDADGGSNGGAVNSSIPVGLDNYWIATDTGNASVTLQNASTNGYLDGDDANEGWDVNQSPSVASDDVWKLTFGAEVTDDRALTDASQFTFGVFGDYGVVGNGAPQVAALVNQRQPDLLLTTGDARYGGQTYSGVHSNYVDYLDGATASLQIPEGGLSEINRFFAAPGNHDFDDSGGISQFQNFFDLPGDGLTSSSGSELYYDFVWGPVHFFVLDSNSFKFNSASRQTQTAWVQNQLQASDSPWQVVVMHHSPYSSSTAHGSDPILQIDYAGWGADLVLSGHDHVYERLQIDDITYVVTGLGGNSTYNFGSPESGSVVRYADNYGIASFTATDSQITGSFVSVDGVTRDTFVITGP